MLQSCMHHNVFPCMHNTRRLARSAWIYDFNHCTRRCKWGQRASDQGIRSCSYLVAELLDAVTNIKPTSSSFTLPGYVTTPDWWLGIRGDFDVVPRHAPRSIRRMRSKDKTLVSLLYNVGPTLKTFGRRCTNVMHMSFILLCQKNMQGLPYRIVISLTDGKILRSLFSIPWGPSSGCK